MGQIITTAIKKFSDLSKSFDVISSFSWVFQKILIDPKEEANKSACMCTNEYCMTDVGSNSPATTKFRNTQTNGTEDKIRDEHGDDKKGVQFA